MFKDWFLYNNIFCAVEHAVNAQGEEYYNYLLLKKKRNELLIEHKGTFFSNKELINFLNINKQKHLVLVVNNVQVLSKTINKPQENQNLLQLAYPNLNSKEFYHQYKNIGDQILVAIARKSYLDDLINIYTSEQISVLDFSLGSLSVFEIIDLFNLKEINTSNSKILVKSNNEFDLEFKHFSHKEYTVNGLDINSNNVLTLGVIINFYLKANLYQNKIQFEHFKNKTLFNKGYKVALIFCFFILLINFLVFSSYYKKITKLNSYIEMNSNAKEELKLLHEKVSEKENLLNQIQDYSSFTISKYIDEIVNEIPSTILLTDLNYQPFLNPVKENKEIKNELKTIKISGDFKVNSDISKWIDVLEKLNWVKEVSKLSIENTKKTSKFNFSIIIKDEL